MEKRIPRWLFLSVLFSLGFLASPTKLPAQAYDMSYQDTSGVNPAVTGRHAFTLHYYQNCAANMVGFNGMMATVYMVGLGGTVYTAVLPGGMQVLGMGNPFCQNQSPVCSAAGPLNYQKSGYTFIWPLSTHGPGTGITTVQTKVQGGSGNFQAANIAGTFDLEPATFNVLAAGMVNVPPHFINPPVIFANVNQPVSFSAAALDADGDSLVYRLRPASPNATYAAGFTYLNPITANPALLLHPRTGSITFTPTVFDQTAGPGSVANKYIIGLDVEEYRKLNGVITKIGTIQRNILVNVVNNGPQNPVLTANYRNKDLPADTVIEATVGSQVVLNFNASDPDPLKAVYPVSNVYSVLPNAIYAASLGQNPNWGVLYWTPTAADVRSETYFFNVAAVNDACPYLVSVSKTFGISVRQVNGNAGKGYVKTAFSVFPNPAGQEVNFKFETRRALQEIQIYNILGKMVDRISLANANRPNEAVRWPQAEKYPSGTYIARLISEDQTVQVLKFLKR